MAPITLPSEVIQQVLKFVPYENATKLAQTSKSWVNFLQAQLKEQQMAIKAEIRRLESTDLGEEYRRYHSTYNRLIWKQMSLDSDFKSNVKHAYSVSEQQAAIASFNERLQEIEDDKDAAISRFRANARKRQPIIDKIESLESKLDQCRKPEAERFADLKRRRMCCGIAMFVTVLLGLSVLGVPIALIIGYLTGWEELPLYSCILSVVSLIGLTLLVLAYKKLNRVYGNLDLKVSRYENKKYVD